LTTALRKLREAKAVKVLYTALILDPASHTAVQKWFEQVSGEPLLDTVFAHHITIQFKPSESQVADIEVGSKASVKVVGWASDDKIQVVVVSGLTVASGVPHVTLATAPGTSPAYAKQLLQDSYTRAGGPVLTGQIEAVMGK